MPRVCLAAGLSELATWSHYIAHYDRTPYLSPHNKNNTKLKKKTKATTTRRRNYLVWY